MTKQFALECFDEVDPRGIELHPEYQRGFQVGFAAAQAETEVAALALHDSLVATLDDASFSYAEARQVILAEIGPLMNAVVTSLLPSVATLGVATTIEDILMEASASSMPQSPTVCVHQDHFDLLNSLLSQEILQNVTLTVDPIISKHGAWMTTSTGEASVDFDAVVDAAKTALSTYLHSNFKDVEHG